MRRTLSQRKTPGWFTPRLSATEDCSLYFCRSRNPGVPSRIVRPFSFREPGPGQENLARCH